MIQLNLFSQIQLLIHIFYKILQKNCNHQKYFYLLCNSKKESRKVNYGTGHKKGGRGLKGPRRPTELSELLNFEEGSRPTPPTTVIFLLFLRPTSLQNTVSINFCSDWLTWNIRQYRPTFVQTEPRLQAAKI